MLIVCGIVLMTAVFSGCADVAPDTDESPQTQLGDAPTEEPTVSSQALYKQITNPAVIRGAMGKDIDLYRIPANVLGTPDKKASDGNMWKNIAGFEKYLVSRQHQNVGL